ncbi:NAD/NADP-dependent octopine/nopaline dehydrogenase family protein [Sulfitobacter aestuariivivens]|uniref:NAD/NADP octopine/nopaline dehydrogenase family protein n=1 Tax=Sulfitobacter aestuariivivens TaxID=2766981 RepID=A0A927HFK6_9RHOB|nr:NAD/NADP-dependent octopine/nopaline dehydrogenase family protein [Sulfitobacter aestuariivivens]MBD3664538.1 NAD/NADP octopine/nopaline dehydrogenase family protein [Sulfitobacter aestuariivivens]
MEIAVLGGGNGSSAAALDLTDQGHRVRLWRRNKAGIADLNARGNTLTLKDFAGTREEQIAVATTDIGDAIRDAELIVCPTPATAQEDIARVLAPHLVDGQVVYLPPGSFGSVLMARIARDAGSLADVTFAEAGTLPYLTRLHGGDTVAITTRATALPSGFFPRRNAGHAMKVIKQAYPAVIDSGDGLSGALMNAGPIIHPPLILMNAGPIEHFDHWDIHNEGTQPAIRRVTTRLDAERMMVREALGYGAPHWPLADHYDPNEEWMYGGAAHEKLTDSGDWRENLVLTEHRYMREDVACGLAFLVSVADWAGVPAPTARGLLAVASAICDTDFEQTGRTLASMGLAQLSRTDMQQMLETGL